MTLYEKLLLDIISKENNIDTIKDLIEGFGKIQKTEMSNECRKEINKIINNLGGAT